MQRPNRKTLKKSQSHQLPIKADTRRNILNHNKLKPKASLTEAQRHGEKLNLLWVPVSVLPACVGVHLRVNALKPFFAAEKYGQTPGEEILLFKLNLKSRQLFKMLVELFCLNSVGGGRW